MRLGPLAALDAIKQATGESKVHAHRLLRRRHAARDHARLYGEEARAAHHVGDLLRRPGRLHPCRRPAGVRRRGAARGARAADGRARLPRGQEDGDCLQPAALERPDLALCDQQLPARQGAVPIRPAVLEFRRDPHAGGQPLVLSAQLLPQQPAHQGRDGDRRRQPRSQAGEGAGLQSRHPRGPYRAGKVGVPRRAVLRRTDALRARGLRPYRRRGQPRRKAKYQYWTGAEAARAASRPGSPRPRSIRAPGGRTGSPGSRNRIRRR